MNKYLYRLQEIKATAFGNAYCFTGPNISRYSNSIHLLQPFNEWASLQWTEDYSDSESRKIVGMLNAAYEAGRQSMSQDIRELLGINK